MSTPPTSIEGSATLTRASTLPTAVSTSDTSHLSTIFPEAFQRYWRNVTIPRKQVRHTIPAHTTTFAPDDLRQPSEWVAILHPEGAKYFFHPKRRIFTDADLCKVEIFAEANRVVDHIIKDIQSSGEELSPYYAALLGTGSSASVDLVVDLTSNYGEKSSGYYFINHSHRCPFWLHPMQVDENLAAWHEIEGPIGQEQLRHEMEWQYWYWPSPALSLTKEHVDELQDLIIYSIGDMSTSLYSTVGVSIEQLQDRLSLVEKLQCYLPNPLFAPEVHLESLRKSYVDKTVFGRVWVGVIDKLNTEWQDFTLLATVVLNANVAFLSAQSVDVTYPGRHTPAQIASYLSTLASVGSIILGLLLVRQNRTKFREIAAEISAAMSRRSSNTEFGLELLAVIFSLPYALLIAPDIFTRVTIGSAAAAIFVLVFWCIWDAWDMQEGTVRGPLFLSSWCRTAGTALYSIFHPSLRCFGAEADHAQGDGVPNTQSVRLAASKDNDTSSS
ncbi:hypothetical protein B0H10DRAFT_2214856 [Mycena sp. CBHHK59/15]|nr:hypothetical protein B0H10DRAFT_2214856 [Mycena sp. CBHHK59/15]